MNFRLAYKPRARLPTVNQLGQGNGAEKWGLRSKEILAAAGRNEAKRRGMEHGWKAKPKAANREPRRFPECAFEPHNVISVFRTLQQFLVILDRKNEGNGLAFAGNHFEVGHRCFHARNMPAEWAGANAVSPPESAGHAADRAGFLMDNRRRREQCQWVNNRI